MEITPIITEDFLQIDESDTIAQMIGKLKQHEKRTGLVFRKNKYLGIVEKKKLLRTNLDTTKISVGSLVHNTPLLDEHADIIETAYLMYQSNLDFLPIVRNKQIVGVVRGRDLVKIAMELPDMKKAKVQDVKIEKSVKINKGEPVTEAIHQMWLKHVDQIPIMDGGKLYGVISYKDILRKYLNWSPRRDVRTKFNKMASTKSAEVDVPKIANLPVESFSTVDNLSQVQISESLKNAVNMISERKLSSLLVMKNGDLEGVLTVKNVLRIIASLKIPTNYNIKFVGLSKLEWHAYEKKALKKMAANEAFKLQRLVNNEFSLNIHIKEYEKDGKKRKYSVHLKVDFPGKLVSVSQDDWDWRAAVRKTFANAENKLKKQFK